MKVLIFADLVGKRHDTCKLQVCTSFSDHSAVLVNHFIFSESGRLFDPSSAICKS